MSSDEFPVHESLDVLDGQTIYKNEEWWKAIVAYERYGRRIGVYLWHYREEDDKWVRKQKYVIKSKENWEADREVVDHFLPYLDEDTDLTSARETVESANIDTIVEDVFSDED